MSRMIVTATPATLDLDQLGAIPPAWVLSGNPETRSKILGRTHDWTSNIVVWECGAGSYTWHYNQDEVIIVISGEGFMTNGKGEERRFGRAVWDFFLAAIPARGGNRILFERFLSLRNLICAQLGFDLRPGTRL